MYKEYRKARISLSDSVLTAIKAVEGRIAREAGESITLQHIDIVASSVLVFDHKQTVGNILRRTMTLEGAFFKTSSVGVHTFVATISLVKRDVEWEGSFLGFQIW